MIGQYKTPLPASRLYAINHTILAITVSRKGQATAYMIYACVYMYIYIITPALTQFFVDIEFIGAVQPI